MEPGTDNVPMSDHEFSKAARKLLNVGNNDEALAAIGALVEEKEPEPFKQPENEEIIVDPSELPE